MKICFTRSTYQMLILPGNIPQNTPEIIFNQVSEHYGPVKMINKIKHHNWFLPAAKVENHCSRYWKEWNLKPGTISKELTDILMVRCSLEEVEIPVKTMAKYVGLAYRNWRKWYSNKSLLYVHLETYPLFSISSYKRSRFQACKQGFWSLVRNELLMQVCRMNKKNDFNFPA